MNNGLHITPEREPRKNHLEWASTRLKAEVDEGNESSASTMVIDTCSPDDSTASAQYNGESLDFGDAGVDLI
ncbi:MAG: hypothetical protein WBN06_16715 [Lysobacterales bacterium]|jgi:hypothetical protein